MKTKKVFLVSSPETGPAFLLRRRILDISKELFFKHGFVRITVDDIASELGISKATFYKSFRSKDELLAAVIENVKEEIRAGIETVASQGETGVLERMSRLMAHIGSWLSKMGPVLARDLRRNAPGVWQDIDKFRRENILVNFKTLVEAGIGEGVIRDDINRELMVQMYLSLVETFLNPGALLESSCSAREIFVAVIKIFFEGILTDKARGEFAGRENRRRQFHKEVVG